MQGKTVVVTPGFKGNSAALNVGDTLEIDIPTLPKDGFTWLPQNLDGQHLEQIGGAVYTASTDPNAAGGTVTLKFKAVGAGSTNLLLIYTNTSQNGSPAVYSKSLGVSVTVK